MIGKGGVVFPLSDKAREKRTEVVVTEEDLQPWIAELKRIVRDATYYEDLCRITEIEGKKHDIEFSTDRFVRALAESARSISGEGSTPLARLATPQQPGGRASAA